MPEELETIVLGENELRLETLTLPNGNTYILGCSFEEAQDIYEVLSDNIEAVNADVEALNESEEVIALSLNDLDSRIVALSNDVDDLKETTADISQLTEDVDGLKESEFVAAASLTDLNSRIVALTQENTSLRNEITELRQEIALIKNHYMAYYDVDETKGIGENNTYTS